MKLQRSLVFLPLFLFLLSGIGVLYLLWFKLDFLYVDIAGHLASAKSFSEGYFQSFNEHFFTGLVQNLFYPPIEDLILSVFTKLIRLSDTHAYLLYMSIVMSAFFYLLYRLTESFKNIAAKSFCSFSLLLLFFAQKEDVMFFQGLGLKDLMLTGLSSEFLGAVFFLAYLYERQQKSRARYLILWSSLAALSHIVVGLVVFFSAFLDWLLTFSVYPKFKCGSAKKLYVFIACLLLSSTFWGPFILERSYIASLSRDFNPHRIFIVFSFAGILLSLSKKNFYFYAAFFLFLAAALNFLASSVGLTLPDFHFNRFLIFAITFLVLGVSQFLGDFPQSKWPKYYVVLFSVVLLFTFQPIKMKDFLQEFHAQSFEWKPGSGPLVGRRLILDDSRAIANASLESFLYLQDKNQNSIKGLFWESSRNNLFLASVLHHLEPIGPALLSTQIKSPLNCEEQQCLMEKSFSVFSIREVLLEMNEKPTDTSFFNFSCLKKYFQQKNNKLYDVFPSSELKLGWPESRFSGYRIVPKIATEQNPYVEVLPTYSLGFLKLKSQADRVSAAYNLLNPCVQNEKKLFLSLEEKGRFEKSAPSFVSDSSVVNFKVDFSKVNMNKFKIFIDSSTAVPFFIKMSYFRGFHLFNSKGEELPLFESFPHMLGVGFGEMTLEYKKPWYFHFFNTLSLLSFLVFLFICWKKRFVVKKFPSLKNIN